MSQATQEYGAPYQKRSRSRSRSFDRGLSSTKRMRFYRNMPSKSSLSRSMSTPLIHTFTKACSLQMNCTNTGFSFDVGTTQSTLFTIWFTNQAAYIMHNASNYSTVFVPGYTDLSALFDEVKISAIEITILSGCDPIAYGGTGSNGSPIVALATDYNDRATPASLGDVQQYIDCKNYVLANNYVHKRLLYPKFLTYSLESTGSPVASTPKRGFVKSTLDVEHYGLKGAFVMTAPQSGRVVFNFKFKYVCKIEK